MLGVIVFILIFLFVFGLGIWLLFGPTDIA